MASLAAMSSTCMRCASATNSPLMSLTGSVRNCSNLTRMRRIAQNRFTAVGRVPANTLQIVSKSRSNSGTVFACDCSAPSATPMAAATPIAGAPRTIMVRMASATSSYVLQVT